MQDCCPTLHCALQLAACAAAGQAGGLAGSVGVDCSAQEELLVSLLNAFAVFCAPSVMYFCMTCASR
jgi:hypothetical protein